MALIHAGPKLNPLFQFDPFSAPAARRPDEKVSFRLYFILAPHDSFNLSVCRAGKPFLDFFLKEGGLGGGGGGNLITRPTFTGLI